MVDFASRRKRSESSGTPPKPNGVPYAFPTFCVRIPLTNLPFASYCQVLAGSGKETPSSIRPKSAYSSVAKLVSERSHSKVATKSPVGSSYWSTADQASRSRSRFVVRTPAYCGTRTVLSGGKFDAFKLGSPENPPDPTDNARMHPLSNATSR